MTFQWPKFVKVQRHIKYCAVLSCGHNLQYLIGHWYWPHVFYVFYAIQQSHWIKGEPKCLFFIHEMAEQIHYRRNFFYLAGDGGGLKQGGGPGPLGDDSCRSQADGDFAWLKTKLAKTFCIVCLITSSIKSGVQVIGVMINVLPNLEKSFKVFGFHFINKRLRDRSHMG